MALNKIGSQSGRLAVWDLPIRLFHWSLLFAVLVSIVSVEIFDDTELHLQSGQIVLGLLVFRLVWGVVGSSSAQFHRFVRGPRAILDYLRGKPLGYVGHSPMGALSVVAILASLSIQVLTGMGSDDEIFTTGPLAQYLSESQVGWANQIHEWNSKLLFALIGLHLAAILFYQFLRKTNLIGPMITGHVEPSVDQEGTIAAAHLRPLWLALIVAGLAALVAWSVFQL